MATTAETSSPPPVAVLEDPLVAPEAGAEAAYALVQAAVGGPPAGLRPDQTLAVRNLVQAARWVEARADEVAEELDRIREAYEEALARLDLRRRAVRALLLLALDRNGGRPFRFPDLGTVSCVRGRERLEIPPEQEAALIARLEAAFGGRALAKCVLLGELRGLVDSEPGAFEGLVRRVVGEPSVRISRQ